MPKNIKILIVDEQRLFRQGLRALLEGIEGMIVVGEAGDGSEAVDLAVELSPDVVLIDAMLPVMDGISTAKRMKSLKPNIEVLILTKYRNETYQREAFSAGVRGYLMKDCGIDDVVEALKIASTGEYYLRGEVGKDLVTEYIQPVVNAQEPGSIMTQREKELARLLADGYSTKEAASVLNISPKTAETHRASVMKKLGAKNVADIVKYCIRNHIIEA